MKGKSTDRRFFINARINGPCADATQKAARQDHAALKKKTRLKRRTVRAFGAGGPPRNTFLNKRLHRGLKRNGQAKRHVGVALLQGNVLLAHLSEKAVGSHKEVEVLGAQVEHQSARNAGRAGGHAP